MRLPTASIDTPSHRLTNTPPRGPPRSLALSWHATVIPARTYPIPSDLGSQAGLGRISTTKRNLAGTPGAVAFCSAPRSTPPTDEKLPAAVPPPDAKPARPRSPARHIALGHRFSPPTRASTVAAPGTGRQSAESLQRATSRGIPTAETVVTDETGSLSATQGCASDWQDRRPGAVALTSTRMMRAQDCKLAQQHFALDKKSPHRMHGTSEQTRRDQQPHL